MISKIYYRIHADGYVADLMLGSRRDTTILSIAIVRGEETHRAIVPTTSQVNKDHLGRLQIGVQAINRSFVELLFDPFR